MNNWYHETLYQHYGQRFEVESVLFEDKTDFQHLIIFENKQFGRVMALDGIIQTTTRDEHIYHEVMTHVPIYAHGNVKKVLIIGGGDGGILREVIKHAGIEHITMVEIDAAVIEMSKQYLPSISDGAFEDPRLNLVIGDGMDFAHNTSEKFDVIITDSTDPIGPGEILFTDDFYQSAKKCLRDGGIVSSQNGASFLQEWELQATHRRLSSLYKDASFYLASVPSYIGGFMSLAWATDNIRLRKLPRQTIWERYQEHRVNTKYYNPDIHIASFALPQHLCEMMSAIDTDHPSRAA